MTNPTHTISPLRQRMIDDMSLRKLKPVTQAAYLRAVVRLTRFLRQSPDTATPEDLRQFQLHLTTSGVSSKTLNATITALRFFFAVTLDDHQRMRKMSTVHEPRKLPVILDPDEVKRLLEAAATLKYKAALAAAYGAGLRASEVTHLKVSDIDSQRMLIHVEQGKGSKDRNAMLSPTLLTLLRQWWRIARTEGKMLRGGWLFPGRNPVSPLSTRQLNRAFHAAATAVSVNIVARSFMRNVFPTTQSLVQRRRRRVRDSALRSRGGSSFASDGRSICLASVPWLARRWLVGRSAERGHFPHAAAPV